MLGVYAVRLTEPVPDARFDRLAALLPDERRIRLGRFRRRADAERTLLADILIRYLIRQRLGIRTVDVELKADRFGKPHLSGRNDFHFNLSHSGEWIAAAVHDRPVGIDVEQLRPIDLTIARRYFTAEECGYLFDGPEDGRLSRFFKLWTGKESYIKAVGQGMSLPLQSFSVRVQALEAAIWSDADVSDRAGGLMIRLYALPGGQMAVCADASAGGGFPVEPVKMTSPELIESFMRETIEGGTL